MYFEFEYSIIYYYDIIQNVFGQTDIY